MEDESRLDLQVLWRDLAERVPALFMGVQVETKKAGQLSALPFLFVRFKVKELFTHHLGCLEQGLHDQFGRFCSVRGALPYAAGRGERAECGF